MAVVLSPGTLAGIVRTGRGLAESVMADECTITGQSTGTVWDPVTGRETPTPGPELYSGRCRVQLPAVQTREADAGGHEWSARSVVVSVPVDAGDIPAGSVVAVTEAALDAALAGRTYRVVSAAVKSAGTARRLTCEEVVG